MVFLNPEQILNQLELKEEMMAADFGSGSGGWVIPLAKRLRMGRVYALDIQAEALSALKVKAENEKLNNIKTIKADLEQDAGSFIQSNLLDLVLMSNLLFQIKNKEKAIGQAVRVLRQGGRLLIVDWKPDAVFGPAEKRAEPSKIKEIADKSGLVLEKEISAGAYHWGLLFTKI